MTMADVSETESLEDLTDLLLVQGQQGPQEYFFLIGSPDQNDLFSALRKVPILDQSDIEEIIENKNKTEFNGEGIYTFTRLLHDDISPYLSPVKGVEYHDLGSVSDANDFLTRAEQDINAYFQKYAQLLKASMRMVRAYETRDRASWVYRVNELKEYIPSPSHEFIVRPIEEISWLAKQKGKNRDKLIAMQCRIIDAIIKEEYSHAEELGKKYERMTLK